MTVRPAALHQPKSGADSQPFAGFRSQSAKPGSQLPTTQPPPLQVIVACAIALFGFAALPRPEHGEKNKLAAAGARSSAIDPAAETAFRALERESPQAAAYAISSLEPFVRAGVLELCRADRRAAIEAFLLRRQ